MPASLRPGDVLVTRPHVTLLDLDGSVFASTPEGVIGLDGVDGYVARKRNETSVFGSIFDIAIDRVVENVLWVVLADLGLAEEQVAFIGDDVVDLPLLSRVGFAVSVPNGRKEAHDRSHYITEAAGGRGAVREACEFVLRASGSYDRVMAQFLV